MKAGCGADGRFVSAVHIPASRPRLLLAGGGEPTLQVFDWTTGALQGRVDVLGAIAPYRAVRPPARKIKGKRKAVGSGATAPSDDPASPGWFAAPEGHMYPIGAGVAIGQIGSVDVDGQTVVLFYSRGASALHAFVLNEDGSAGEVRSLGFAHPVLGFAPLGGQVLVTLDNTHAAVAPSSVPAAPVALVTVGADATLTPAGASPLLSALTQSLAAPALQIPEQDAAKLNLYADLQILPRWPGFEDDEAGAESAAKADELAPKRLGRLKAQGHDVHVPAKKKRKSKAERKRARAGEAGGKSEDTSEVATGGEDEESAMNA